jgi:DNA-binding protein HU-beta
MLSKSQLVEKIATEHGGLSKKDVKGVLEALITVGHKELKKTGTFLVPGFAKFVVTKKPATKEREGINPFTKLPTIFKAKPARKIVRARPVKAAEDAV